MSYFRTEIDAMSGYAPGEQPKDLAIIKLNTNENPYPPSPDVAGALGGAAASRLRLYPDPVCSRLRKVIADLHCLEPDNVIVGNGSDDILTIAMRCFSGEGLPVACVEPTYSLYSVLAKIQGADCVSIPLKDDFSLPDNLLEQLDGINLFLLPRPNAPTGNSFPLGAIKNLCSNFKGIILIDEAYADFADDNCVAFAREYPNVIVSRTLSKSYSLAGARLGFAMADKNIIDGMMKVKDSYNVNALTQSVAAAALLDQEYFRGTVAKIKATRKLLDLELKKLGFEVLPSQANFIFASPPDKDGEKYFNFLKEQKIFVRYFSGGQTGRFVRITIGTDAEIDKLLEATRKHLLKAESFHQ